MDSVEAEFFAGALIAPPEWPAIAAALAQGAKTDCEQARAVRRARCALSGSDRIETYIWIFFAPIEAQPAQIHRDQGDQGCGTGRAAQRRTGTRLCQVLERRNAVACRDRSAALLTVAEAVLTRYRGEKERRGLLDYDDLIDKTLALLNSVEAAWVHYKLDLGIDHVLIDEAQDTS